MSAGNRVISHPYAAILGLIAAIPLLLFVSLNILKYELGLMPGIEIIPIHPAVIVGGGMAAILLNAWSIMQFRVTREDHKLWVMLGFVNRPWNLVVLLLAGAFLLAVLGYVVVENLTHLVQLIP
jgi:hypothetical protein